MWRDWLTCYTSYWTRRKSFEYEVCELVSEFQDQISDNHIQLQEREAILCIRVIQQLSLGLIKLIEWDSWLVLFSIQEERLK